MLASRCFKKLQELLMAMARLALGDDPAVNDVQCREERGSAVAIVIVRYPLDIASPIGGTGWVRSKACTWLFSSTHNTSASSGGLR